MEGQGGLKEIFPLLNGSTKQGKDEIIALLDNFISNYRNKRFYYRNEILDQIIDKLSRARKEFDATRFFVLIVGPLKSGKSTFVNILSRARVSPTDVLECTAIPTIIGKAEGDHLHKIVSFFPKNEQFETEEEKIKNDEELFDHIIDVLRGIEPSTVIEGQVKTDICEATDENINRVIMIDKECDEKKPMIATIGVEDKGFIDDQIMIIDMPGLDGKDVNDRNPLYQRMVERADFIFFIQSSTSAINEATNDFLNWLLSNRLTKVPLRLIHNYHESLYFINDSITKQIIDRQISAGVKCIREKFNVTHNFDNYVLNFAKISNYLMSPNQIKDDLSPDIAENVNQYLSLEKQIVESLKKERQSIKDDNCVHKSKGCILQSIELLKNLSISISDRIKKINEVLLGIEGFRAQYLARDISFAQLMETVSKILVDEEIEKSLLSSISNATAAYSNHAGEIKGADLMKEINNLALSYSNFTQVNANSKVWMSLQECTKTLFDQTYSDISNSASSFLGNELSKEISITANINNTLFPTAFMAFCPNYYDIREYRRFFGLNNKLSAKHYSYQEHREYLYRFKADCENLVSDKINEYKSAVKTALSKIRDEWVKDILAQLEKYSNEVREIRNEEKTQLLQQQSSINQMLHELGFK